MGGNNSTLNIENVELKKQINVLKSINKNHEKKIIQLSKNVCTGSCSSTKEQKIKKKISNVSKEKINTIVDKLLKNPDTNISYLPDFVEKKIYTNVFGIVLNLLDDVLDTTAINFLGHKIKLDLTTDNDDIESKTKTEEYKPIPISPNSTTSKQMSMV
jgi:ABC-type anion transport system duplicated permease subunit